MGPQFLAPPEVRLQSRCWLSHRSVLWFLLHRWEFGLGAEITAHSTPHFHMKCTVLCARFAASVFSVVSDSFFWPAAGLTVGLVFAATFAITYGMCDICVYVT